MDAKPRSGADAMRTNTTIRLEVEVVERQAAARAAGVGNGSLF